MKYLNGDFYVEVKNKRYKICPTENVILGLREEPKSLRTQNQAQKNTQIRKNQKFAQNNGRLLVKKFAKNDKQPNIHIPKTFFPSCPSSKRSIWLQLDKGRYSQNREYFNKKQKYPIDKKSTWTKSKCFQ